MALEKRASKKIVFTLCSNNYIAQATVLGDSVIRHNPDYLFCIGLVDKHIADVSYPESEKSTVIPVDKLVNPEIQKLISTYGIVEFNTAVKPFYFEYFFQQYKAETIIYLDPDICVYSSFAQIDNILKEYSIVITPHANSPLELDGLYPNDTVFLKYGVFNLGFIALRNYDSAKNFIHWWQERLINYGRNSDKQGTYVDQKWINLVPVFFPDLVYILEDPGYNMAFWNLHERMLGKKNEQWMVNEKYPLVFFHFSQFDPIRFRLAKGQNRYSFTNRQDLKPLFETYQKALMDAGYRDLINLKNQLIIPQPIGLVERTLTKIGSRAPKSVLRFFTKLSQKITRIVHESKRLSKTRHEKKIPLQY